MLIELVNENVSTQEPLTNSKKAVFTDLFLFAPKTIVMKS